MLDPKAYNPMRVINTTEQTRVFRNFTIPKKKGKWVFIADSKKEIMLNERKNKKDSIFND